MTNIWEAKLDNKFDCAVARINENMGKLTVKDNTGRLLLDEFVSLAYGAQFGPDIDDVRTWEDMCVEVVDKQ